MLTASRLVAHLRDIHQELGTPYCANGDLAYQLGLVMQCGFKNTARTRRLPHQERYNVTVNSKRISVELGFGYVKTMFPL